MNYYSLGSKKNTSRHYFKWLCALAFGVIVTIAVVRDANALQNEATWHPESSERLIKLPASYLKKSIDTDFSKSALGEAIRDAENEIKFKLQTLEDLHSALGEAKGEVLTELRHQFLAEKRNYIDLIARKHELRRRRLNTEQNLLQSLQKKITADKSALTPARVELVEQQEFMRNRFENSVTEVDMKLLTASAVPQSNYGKDYETNLTAIKSLVQAITVHPMQMKNGRNLDDLEMTKEEYLRKMLAENQAKLALIDQEEGMLGYMAKLIALDAMALSEEVVDFEIIDSDVPVVSVASSVTFFTNN